MSLIRLIHWHAAEAEERAERLVADGFDVACEIPHGTSFLRELSQDPPAAVVIDLGRLPSRGRDIALQLRKYKGMRYVPLVFVDGAPEKVARIKALLPDAVYATWAEIRTAIASAIEHPPADPVVPESLFDGYAGKPLWQKLGIKEHAVVVLVGAPPGFRGTLGDLPDGVTLHRGEGKGDLILWFTRSRAELEGGIGEMVSRLSRGSVWIAWPKKASGVALDLTQQCVREVGLAAGLVDYKICSIDATWSGLLFTRRKTKKRDAGPAR